jgi:hypothetical protein
MDELAKMRFELENSAFVHPKMTTARSHLAVYANATFAAGGLAILSSAL